MASRIDPTQQRILRAALSAFIACLAALATPGALAHVFYTYYGNTFLNATGEYTTSDSVQGEIMLADALPEDMPVFTAVVPLAFRFIDGVNVIETSRSNIVVASFEFRTVMGQIVDWRFGIVSDEGSGFFATVSSVGGIGSYREDMLDIARLGGYEGSVAQFPGAWEVTVMPAPEPGTLVLVALALVVMACTVRQQRRGVEPVASPDGG